LPAQFGSTLSAPGASRTDRRLRRHLPDDRCRHRELREEPALTNRKTVRAAAFLLGGVAVAGAAWIAIPADAATTGVVSVVNSNVIVYAAATGRANTVVVSRSGNTITVDDVHGIKAGAGCATVSGDKTKIRCTPRVAPAWVRVDVQDGNDTVVNNSGLSMSAWGRAGNDRITGGPRGDNLLGGDGVDAIWGLAGNDRVTGEGGGDALSGGDGDDIVSGGPAGDRLLGGNGSDDLTGGAGSDVEDGGAGDDAFYQDVDYAAGTDSDSFIGGADDDVVAYWNRSKAITADADAVKGDDGSAGENDTIGSSVEAIFGGAGNDRIIGTARDEVFFGGAGNDQIAASSGDDVLEGESGTDHLNGADGTDYCPDREAGETVLSCELGAASAKAKAVDRGKAFAGRVAARR
jgi:Ca2+-binding RTX toxin-like protein